MFLNVFESFTSAFVWTHKFNNFFCATRCGDSLVPNSIQELIPTKGPVAGEALPESAKCSGPCHAP